MGRRASGSISVLARLVDVAPEFAAVVSKEAMAWASFGSAPAATRRRIASLRSGDPALPIFALPIFEPVKFQGVSPMTAVPAPGGGCRLILNLLVTSEMDGPQ